MAATYGHWEGAREQKPDGACQWFLLCDRPASATEPHPVLGDVPICGRCKTFVDAIGVRGEEEGT